MSCEEERSELRPFSSEPSFGRPESDRREVPGEGSRCEQSVLPVSLIIPILNEERSLPFLLDALEKQRIAPQEIIVVDAGSEDEGVELIHRWWGRRTWQGATCRVLLHPGATPGEGRNRGVRDATNEWVAFLDAGLVPDSDWLDALWRCVQSGTMSAAFGTCIFTGSGVIGRALCALSYGQESSHPILAASLFSRRVLETVGPFSATLQAGEDLLWIKRFVQAYGEKPVCHQAKVLYPFFSATFSSALGKWCSAAASMSRGWVSVAQQIAHMLAAGVWLVSLMMDVRVAVVLLLVYILWRGVVDPMRRSFRIWWWRGEMLAMPLAIVLGISLDVAKLAGFVLGHAQNLTGRRV